MINFTSKHLSIITESKNKNKQTNILEREREREREREKKKKKKKKRRTSSRLQEIPTGLYVEAGKDNWF